MIGYRLSAWNDGSTTLTSAHYQSVRPPGAAPAITDEQRWILLARLLHDDDLELTDRVGGALLLLYGQQLSRITALSTAQLRRHDEHVFLRLGRDEITIPEPLAGLLTTLARDGRRYLGVGSPTATWLFPGLLPGRPLTPARLGERLRALGIYAQPGRRTALTGHRSSNAVALHLFYADDLVSEGRVEP